MRAPKRPASPMDPELPAFVTTVDGFTFPTFPARWHVPTPTTILCFAFDTFPGATTGLLARIRRVTAHLLARSMPERAANHLVGFRALVDSAGAGRMPASVDTLSLQGFREYVVGLPAASTMGRVAQIALRAWRETGIGGLEPDLLRGLDRVETRGHQAGRATRTMSPKDGALSKAQKQEVLWRLRERYEDGSLSEADYAMGLIATLIAPRPGQLARLKASSLTARVNESGVTERSITLEYMKVRGRRPGAATSERPLNREIAEVLLRQSLAAQAEAPARGIDPANAPMFWSRRGTNSSGYSTPELPGFEGHMMTPVACQRLSSIINRLGLTTASGEPLRASAVRWRRTGASELRSAGCTGAVISHFLGHAGTGSWGIYAEETPELISRIGSAMDAGLRRYLPGADEPLPEARVPDRCSRRGRGYPPRNASAAGRLAVASGSGGREATSPPAASDRSRRKR